ncbi:hypothetical protein [Neobacillus massiliamazoniensis]|jgi:hypothetical protein|uniref:DUF2007 domain-containing protein n=1 Tax=Neobacillus massiliamazoniensis TaxID=1499688 RepID=A0A0U1NXL7_9BACI|nr:hypothetical protein [Neobacillus massiliamazoniensis]CRK82770.1 hypothetical protein BN000_02716 [Neobacillus massiliamazoniensis]
MNVFIIFLIIFAPILLLFATINYFSYKNWIAVYIALNDENYFRAVGKLKQTGIQYKTKTLFNPNTTPMFGGDRQRQYEIYVKKHDIHIASQNINSLKDG